MNKQQRRILQDLKRSIATSGSNLPLEEQLLPIYRFIISLLAIHKGYSSIGKEELDELTKEYYSTPTAVTTLLLQSINSLDLIESIIDKSEKEYIKIEDNQWQDNLPSTKE